MGIERLILTQVIVYSVAVLIVALTLAIVLDLFGLRRLPAEIRKYIYRTFLVGILGLVLAFVTGVLKTPGEIENAVGQVVARSTENNIRLSNARSSAILPEALAGAAPRPADPQSAATVYVQASTLAQKNGAGPFLAALKQAGVKTPGVEIVGVRAPPKAELRYFNDGDKDFAERIAGVARANGFDDVVVKTITSYKAPPGQLEFWYPRAVADPAL
ncbi:hypothetical protein ACFSCV_15505 [Methylopila henanensis]|uniref:Uncharacterized protein n=1 Tax=Methylopila henanensis TaxID=873516 RepID=A0ABW4K8B8_9HYPH